MVKKAELRLLFYIFFLFLLLLLLGLNPYFIPRFYDNVYYFGLAKSLLGSGSYKVMGQYIFDWPPLYPLFLAAWFAVFGPSVLIGKLSTLATAPAALFAIYLLCKQERRTAPLLLLLVTALLPTGIGLGTRIATEWLYLLLSCCFLLTMNSMRASRSMRAALASGLLLGLAALTRYFGALLGVALIAQALPLLKKGGLLRIKPELASALIGASISGAFFAWMHWVQAQPGADVYQGNYLRFGAALWEHFHLSSFSDNLLDLLIQWPDLLKFLGPPWSSLLSWLAPLPLLLIVAGFCKRVRPSDLYVFSLLLLLLFYKWKISRFILAIAPFLIDYLLSGFCLVISLFKGPKRHAALNAGKALAALWCLALFSIDLHLLFLGNRNDFNGLSPLASPTAKAFYKDPWKEIHALGKELKKEGAYTLLIGPLVEDVLVYFYGFSEGRAAGFNREGKKPDYLIVESGYREEIPEGLSLQLLKKEKSMSLFRVVD